MWLEQSKLIRGKQVADKLVAIECRPVHAEPCKPETGLGTTIRAFKCVNNLPCFKIIGRYGENRPQGGKNIAGRR